MYTKIPSFSAIWAGISGVNYEQNLAEEESSFGLSLALWMDLGHDFSPHIAIRAACKRHKTAQPIVGKLPWPHGSVAVLSGYVPVFLLLNRWSFDHLCYSPCSLNLCPSGFLNGVGADTCNLSWNSRMADSGHLSYIVRHSFTPTLLRDVVDMIWWWSLLDVANWFDDALLSTCLFHLAICPCTFACYRLNKLIHSSHEHSYHRLFLKTTETKGCKSSFSLSSSMLRKHDHFLSSSGVCVWERGGQGRHSLYIPITWF